MDFFTSPQFLLYARLAVGGVFLVSGVAKMLDKPGTEASMARYVFMPKGSGKLISNLFPILEIIVGLMLVLGLLTQLAAVGALALFAVFTGLIMYDLTHNRNVSCHCFGKLTEEKVSPMSVVRNVFLMALSVLLVFAPSGWLSLDAIINQTASAANVSAADAVPIALLALATVGLVVLGGQAVATVRTTLRGIGYRS